MPASDGLRPPRDTVEPKVGVLWRQGNGATDLYDPLSDSRAAAVRAGEDGGRAAFRLAEPAPDGHAEEARRYYFADPASAPAPWNVELVDACTLSCRHCYQRSRRCDPWQRPATPHNDRWQDLAEALLALGPDEVSITGGEVLLSDAAAPLLAYLRSRRADLRLRVLLSGVAPVQRRAFQDLVPDLRRLGVRAKVALYGPSEAVHDWITRSPGSWLDTLEMIDALRDAEVPTSVSYEMLGRTAHAAEETVAFLNERVGGAFTITTLIYPPRDPAAGWGPPDLLPPARLADLLGRPAFAALPVDYLSFQPRCGSGCRFPTVTASGRVLSCAVVGGSDCGEAYGNGEALAIAGRSAPSTRAADAPGPCGECAVRPICKQCVAFLGKEGPLGDYCALVKESARVVVERIRTALEQGYQFLHPEAEGAWNRLQPAAGVRGSESAAAQPT